MVVTLKVAAYSVIFPVAVARNRFALFYFTWKKLEKLKVGVNSIVVSTVTKRRNEICVIDLVCSFLRCRLFSYFFAFFSAFTDHWLPVSAMTNVCCIAIFCPLLTLSSSGRGDQLTRAFVCRSCTRVRVHFFQALHF